MSKAIFLDRDNTLIKDEGYFHDPDAIVFMDGVIESLRSLQNAGYLLIVITNQSGIGRGYFPESDTLAVHAKLTDILAAQGIRIEKIYYCPHAPEDDCECRKPKPFLILKAAQEYNIDLARSFFIGDHMKDMEAGKTAGTKTIMIGETASIAEATQQILSNETLHGTIQE